LRSSGHPRGSRSLRRTSARGDFGAYAFGLFHLAIVTHWLRDRSRGKEQTLALLDRC